MSRRYLSQSEVEAAFRRNRSVECFLGYCSRDGRDGIRWLSISSHINGVKLSLYESADLGSSEYIDLYSFGPLNEELELENADVELLFGDESELFEWLDQNHPMATSRLVNQFVVQDEYLEYINNGRNGKNA